MIITQVRASGRLDQRAQLFLAILAGVTLLASAGATVLGGPVLGLVFGPAYAAAGLILAVYLGSVFFVAAGAIGSRVLAAQGVSGPQIWSGLAGALSNVVLSILFGEVTGPEGVALATVVSYAVAAILLWQAVIKRGRATDRKHS
jgi:O-antigen/teichoic acid export membrane protein